MDSVSSKKTLPYAKFTEDDLRELIRIVRGDDPMFFDLTAFHDNGWESHPDLRVLKQKVPPRSIDRLLLISKKNDVTYTILLNLSSPSYYGRDIELNGGTLEAQEKVYDRFLRFFDLRSRGRLPGLLANFVTLALGGYVFTGLIAIIVARAMNLLGLPSELQNWALPVGAWAAAIAALLSMIFVSRWITPHIELPGWGRFHNRRQLLSRFVSLVVVAVLSLTVEWLIRGR